jgi:hypothetical protein
MLIPLGLYVKPSTPEKNKYIKRVSNFDAEYKKFKPKRTTKNKRIKHKNTKKYYS